MTKVAFLGLGTMGREMALNLVMAGHDVTVWNRTPAKTADLVDAGAAAALSPAEAADGAEVIISIVGDDPASREVWLGKAGVLNGQPAPDAIAVESSTLSRGWMGSLGHEVETKGLRFLDCPVTGGPDGAREKRLTLLVGGEQKTLEAAWPVLQAYAERYIHFGEIGTGTAYKLIVNTIGAAQATAAAEGLAIADKVGLPMDKVVEALSSGAVASPLTADLVKRVAEDDHDDVYFTTRWRHKDASYGLRMAVEVGQATPTLDAAKEVFTKALTRGLADINESIVCKMVKDG